MKRVFRTVEEEKKRQAARSRKHYLANIDKMKANARRWAEENPQRVKINRKRYYLENREHALAQAAKWSSSPEGKASHKKYVKLHRAEARVRSMLHFAKNKESYYAKIKQWKAANPHKLAAHHAVIVACRNGVLTRPSICSKCGSDVRIEAHHPDYTKQLTVIWLCSSCHKQLHWAERSK